MRQFVCGYKQPLHGHTQMRIRTYLITRRQGVRRVRTYAWPVPSLTWDDLDVEIRWVNAQQETINARGNPNRVYYVIWQGGRRVHTTRSKATRPV